MIDFLLIEASYQVCAKTLPVASINELVNFITQRSEAERHNQVLRLETRLHQAVRD